MRLGAEGRTPHTTQSDECIVGCDEHSDQRHLSVIGVRRDLDRCRLTGKNRPVLAEDDFYIQVRSAGRQFVDERLKHRILGNLHKLRAGGLAWSKNGRGPESMRDNDDGRKNLTFGDIRDGDS